MKHARKDYDRRIQDAEGIIPDDEPVFLLRAQDPLAAQTVRYYAMLYMGTPGADVGMASAIIKHHAAMSEWTPKKDIPDTPSAELKL